jgi:hypothetical protein
VRRKPTPTIDHDAQLARIAWCAAFFATVTLIAILGLARSAQALTVPAVLTSAATTAPTQFEDEDEAEADEEAEASEDEEFDFAECGEDEACVDDEAVEDATEAPPECLLSKAEATVFAAANRDRVRLRIRYTTTSPTPVAVDYGLHGSKGALYLGGDRERFAKHGVLRLTRDLTDKQMAKVMAAKDFTVRLRVSAAPGYCKAFFDHQLDVKHAIPSGLAWEQAE